MKTNASAGCFLVSLTLVAMFADASMAQDPNAGVLYHPSRVLVRFKPAVVASAGRAT